MTVTARERREDLRRARVDVLLDLKRVELDLAGARAAGLGTDRRRILNVVAEALDRDIALLARETDVLGLARDLRIARTRIDPHEVIRGRVRGRRDGHRGTSGNGQSGKLGLEHGRSSPPCADIRQTSR